MRDRQEVRYGSRDQEVRSRCRKSFKIDSSSIHQHPTMQSYNPFFCGLRKKVRPHNNLEPQI